MIHRCPKCHRKIGRYSLHCANCQWNLDDELGEAEPGTWTQTISAETSAEAAEAHAAELGAESQIDVAVEAISKEDFPLALSALNSAIVDADESRLAECYALRGYSLLKLRQFDRAEQDCGKAIELGHNDVETFAWRAAARGQLGRWREAYDDLRIAHETADEPSEYVDLMTRYYESAMSWFRQRIQQGGPSQTQAFSERGWINFYMGDHAKAKRDFELALQHDPHHGPAMLGLAQTSLALNQFDRAVEFCNLTMQSDEKLTGAALVCQVRASFRAGKVRDAVASLQRLRQLANGNADRLYECALLRYEIRDYVGALEVLDQLLQTKPRLIAAYKLRADTYAAINNPALALADYSHVLRLDSNRAAIWVRRGEMNISLNRLDRALRDFDRAADLGLVRDELFLGRARAFEAKGDFENAVQQCKKAQRLVPDSAEVFAMEGRVYFKQKNYSKSIDQLTRAIELAGDDERAEIHYLRGIVHYEMEQLAASLEDLRMAHQLRPKHAGTLIWTAAASARIGDWADVIESFQRAIAVRPSAAEQYKTLGVPIAGKAVEYFTSIIQRDPTDAAALRNRGMAFQFLGSLTAAIDDYSESLKAYEDPQTRLRRGQALCSTGRFREAQEDFGRVLAESDIDHPLHPTALYWRARSHQATGNLDAAFADIRAAIDLASDCGEYPVLLGSLLRRQGETDQAIDALTQAIAIDFTDHIPYALRGQLYVKKRQYLKAIIDFCQSLDLYPNQPEIIAWRGEAYLKNGQSQLALEDFELALTHNPKLVRGYTGRVQVLAERDQHEEATIWITKAIHRFNQPKEWAQLLLARGKVFYQMSRFLPAIADFSAVLDMKRQDPAARNAARYARALAMVQQGQLTIAQRELEILVRQQADFPGAQQALDWLATGQGARPPQLHPPNKMIRPKRPPVMRPTLPMPADDPQWHSQPPHDRWILRMRDPERTEYGPVHKKLLDQWVSEGRVRADTKILRSDWDKWKRAIQIYPQLGSADPAAARADATANDSTPNVVL